MDQIGALQPARLDRVRRRTGLGLGGEVASGTEERCADREDAAEIDRGHLWIKALPPPWPQRRERRDLSSMTPPMSVADLRREYALARLDEGDVSPDPIAQFTRWFSEALAAEVEEPNAMVLATATPDGAPSARVVLLKGVDERGFVFFTDYRSRKGAELEANARAALVFRWSELERQVRITGGTARTDKEESEEYYRSRPLGSRLGAWVSHQSRPFPSRDVL